MSCRLAHDDGVYVLGALAPAERLEFERHLRGCAECTRAVRELAGLPGLLGRVDPGLLEAPPTDGPVPETLLPGLVRQVTRARRRRTLAAAGVAAAAAALLTGGVMSLTGVGGQDGPGPTPTSTVAPTTAARPMTMTPVGDVPVRASIVLEQVGWGTHLTLECTYEPGSADELPPAVDYLLVVRTRDGQTEQVGSWRAEAGTTLRLDAATAAEPDDLASVEVRLPDGRVVLELAV